MRHTARIPAGFRFMFAVALPLACSGHGHEGAGTRAAAPARAELSVCNFDALPLGAALVGFRSEVTGAGPPGTWRIEQDGIANRVLSQLSSDATDNRFPLCTVDGFEERDVSVSCRFKTISGQVDQAAGMVVRFANERKYYVVRANALEDNVRLYHVVDGKRTQFAGVAATVSPGEWHALRLDARGSRFEVFFDGKSLFTADDTTFPDAGRVGLWTKADSVTWFDDFSFTRLAP